MDMWVYSERKNEEKCRTPSTIRTETTESGDQER